MLARVETEHSIQPAGKALDEEEQQIHGVSRAVVGVLRTVGAAKTGFLLMLGRPVAELVCYPGEPAQLVVQVFRPVFRHPVRWKLVMFQLVSIGFGPQLQVIQRIGRVQREIEFKHPWLNLGRNW